MFFSSSIYPRNSGFSLVELMVGMVVGLLGMLVIMQVFAISESGRRTLTAGADAQENGLSALSTVETDVRMAGYGLSHNLMMGSTGCPSGIRRKGLSAMPVTPVTIADDASGSDSIRVVYSASPIGATPTKLRGDIPASATAFDVERTTGFSVNDLIVLSQGGVCDLLQITAIDSAIRRLTAASSTVNPSSLPIYLDGGSVFNIGSLVDVTYSVSNNNVQVVDNNAATPTPVVLANNIVNMQAQYGIGLAGGGQSVTCWVSATSDGNPRSGSDCSTATADWANPTAGNIARIKAVRIALVARSTLQEKAAVTPTDWSLLQGTVTGTLTTDQSKFRYKIYESTIPLRNILWANL
jgi:type IV pilus assembly protein PilW